MNKILKGIMYMMLFVSLYFIYISKTEQDKESLIQHNALRIYM